MKKNSSLSGSIILLITAIIWGTAFVFQSKGTETMQGLTFNGFRCIIGALAVLPIVIIKYRSNKKKGIPFDKKITFIGGLCCGVIFTIASMLQQFAISMTTVGKASFITALYIILVPILGIFLRRKIHKQVWFCACLAVVGMYFLCISGEVSIALGDVLLFISSIFYAAHILVVDYFVEKTDSVYLSWGQLVFCGVIGGGLALVLEHPTPAQVLPGLTSLLYAGVMSCGIAYTLQMVGQKRLNPTAASLIMCLESVVGAISGFLAYKIGFLQTDQSMTARQVLGCLIVFAAVVIVQLPLDRIFKKRTAMSEQAVVAADSVSGSEHE